MPDLSHRPTRYAVTAVTVAALAAGAASSLHLRVGTDAELAAARKRSTRLEEENRALERRVSRQAAAIAAANPAATASASPPNCARYGTQEDAQRAFVADPVGLRSLDGDGDGTACEQLKSVSAGVPPSTPPDNGSATDDASTDEPSPPQQEEATPVSPTIPDVPSKAEIVASGHHFGIATATTEEFDQLEFSLGRDATIRGFYKGWDTPFDAARVLASWQRGEVPVMTWESRPLATADDPTDYSLRRIANGDFDAYLTTFAHDITTLGLPFVLRFDHEMNGNWYRWAEPDPHYDNAKGDYIAAWRHVHDLFEAAGANQLVVWTWSPNRVDNLSRLPSIDNYYPGREYVDWVGMTGYYRPGDGTATFDATYDETLAELRRVAPDVPILLAEVGATETGGKKVGFVQSFFPGLAANPDVVGFIWFNYAVSQNARTNDWRLNSTADVFDAFSTGLDASTYGRERGKRAVLVPRTGSEEPTTTPTTVPVPTSSATTTSTTSTTSTTTSTTTTSTTRPTPSTTTTTGPPPASVASPERQAR